MTISAPDPAPLLRPRTSDVIYSGMPTQMSLSGPRCKINDETPSPCQDTEKSCRKIVEPSLVTLWALLCMKRHVVGPVPGPTRVLLVQ
jgi:hypothetical protein